MSKETILREPPAVRRKLADELRKLATGRRFKPAARSCKGYGKIARTFIDPRRRFKPAERAELARMADAWAATLPRK